MQLSFENHVQATIATRLLQPMSTTAGETTIYVIEQYHATDQQLTLVS
jgi:hypothetical protein